MVSFSYEFSVSQSPSKHVKATASKAKAIAQECQSAPAHPRHAGAALASAKPPDCS